MANLLLKLLWMGRLDSFIFTTQKGIVCSVNNIPKNMLVLLMVILLSPLCERKFSSSTSSRMSSLVLNILFSFYYENLLFTQFIIVSREKLDDFVVQFSMIIWNKIISVWDPQCCSCSIPKLQLFIINNNDVDSHEAFLLACDELFFIA